MSAFSVRNTVRAATKRALDIFGALVGLILLAPVFLVIAILIKRDTPGPVFYRGPRIGKNFVPFKILKFRTMYETEKSYQGARITAKEDDRITPVGRWLRDTKLNELPQLWNVLVGEMSLVGPRPEDPSLSQTWPVDMARDILSVRPGMSSPASILYRYEESMLQASEVMLKYLHELVPDKMRLDQLYVKYQSFWLDLDVIVWTVFLLMPRIRAYSPPERLLFIGPFTHLIQRYINWFGLDFLVVFVSMSLASAVGRMFGPLNVGVLNTVALALGYSVLFSLLGIVFNLNAIKWPKATNLQWASLAFTWMLVTGAAVAVLVVQGLYSFRAFLVIVSASCLSLVGFMLSRYRERLTSGGKVRASTQNTQPRGPAQRVLIVGSGRTAEHIAWLMDHPTYAAKFQILGFIDDNLLLHGMKIYGSKIIGQTKDVPKLIKDRFINLIILADSRLTPQEYDQFQEISNSGLARVVVAPDVFGALAGLDGTTPQPEGLEDLNGFQWLVGTTGSHSRSWRAHSVPPARAVAMRKPRTTAGRK